MIETLGTGFPLKFCKSYIWLEKLPEYGCKIGSSKIFIFIFIFN